MHNCYFCSGHNLTSEQFLHSGRWSLGSTYSAAYEDL